MKNILLQLDEDTQGSKIPVIVEIDLKKITARGSSPAVAEEQEVFQAAVLSIAAFEASSK